MYYQTENPHGGASSPALLDFSVSVNPLGTPERVLAAARAALAAADRYPDPCCRELVRAIAEYEGVPENRILCGCGASELIYAFCAAAKPGLAAGPAPAFSEYAAALALHGCRTARYPLRRETGFVLDAAFLDFLRETAPEAVFLCNPNNPTGRLIPPETLEAIFVFCAETGIRLFVDECFLDLSDGGGGLKGRLSEYPGLFLLKAFTKSFGLAGLRLGYGLSADAALLGRMSALTPPWTVSGPAQAAGRAALGETGFLEEARALVRAERPRLAAALAGLGFRVCPSEANFLLFQGPEGLAERLPGQGAVIRDCGNFPGLGPGWYRAAVRRRAENERLVSALGACL